VSEPDEIPPVPSEHGAVTKLGRRELLRLGGAGLVACALGVAAYRRLSRPRVGDPIVREGQLSPSAFVAIDGAGRVTIWVPKSEMGQGVRTGLAMIVAEELDCAFEGVRVEQAPIEPRFGEMATMASASVRSTYEPLRRAGATLRHMLLGAAASRLGVAAELLDTELGEVLVREGERIPYRDLVAAANALDVPQTPRFREGPRRLLGRDLARRVDVPAKVRGEAVFGLDVRAPGLRFAVLARPVAGTRIERVDVTAARAVPGVEEVLEIEALGAWAVMATSTWAALRGRDALAPVLSRSIHEGLDDDAIERALREAALRREHVGLAIGVSSSDATEARVSDGEIEVSLELHFPYLAHAAMEPLSCTVAFDRDAGTAHVWAPTQSPVAHRDEVAEILGLAPEDVTLEVTYLGGGFGRRAEGDEVREAAYVARVARRSAPIQLVWSREDDLRFDSYRDAAFAQVHAIARADGTLRALDVAMATPSGDPGTFGEWAVKGLFDPLAGLDAQRVTWSGVSLPVRTGIWRSVAHSYTAFVKEHAIDVVARRADAEPLASRRRIYAESPRVLACLEAAIAHTERSAPPVGRARGVAAHACFHSFVAQCAEVSIEGERIRVHRVVVAIDAGRILHPDLVRQQVEGGVTFGLSAALHGHVPIRDGASTIASFADQPLLTLFEAPEIETVILESDEPPTGVGELAVPCIAPAVANALLSLTGRAQRGLPLRL
jgi:isoquinoline 1-oxidoreductase beta subunit